LEQALRPAIKLGRRRVVRRAVLDQWIEQNDGVYIPEPSEKEAPVVAGQLDEAGWQARSQRS